MKDQAVYTILVKGHLSAQWANWFSGMKMLRINNNETCISGLILDQAALHGVLNHIRDLGLILISLKRFEVTQHSDGSLDQETSNLKGIHVSK